jgi:hypothetical protein
MRREVAVGLLVVMLAGLVTNGLAMWRTQGVVESRVDTIEKETESMQDKIDDIHWHLIDSKGIKINRRR